MSLVTHIHDDMAVGVHTPDFSDLPLPKSSRKYACPSCGRRFCRGVLADETNIENICWKCGRSFQIQVDGDQTTITPVERGTVIGQVRKCMYCRHPFAVGVITPGTVAEFECRKCHGTFRIGFLGGIPGD